MSTTEHAHVASPTRMVACDRCQRFTLSYHAPPRVVGSVVILCPACWRRAQKDEANAAAVSTAVAEALAWRLIELEERITETRRMLAALRGWTQFLGGRDLALLRAQLGQQLAERRGLKRRLAKEMGR